MDYIDLKEMHGCVIKYGGKALAITTMVRKNNKLYVMLAGGYLLEVDQDTFDKFGQILYDHMKKNK